MSDVGIELIISVFAGILVLQTYGFVLNSNPLAGVTLDPQDSNDVQYLHLFLADEKAERMRLQSEVDSLKEIVNSLDEQSQHNMPSASDFDPKCRRVAFRTQLTMDIGSVHTGHVVIFDRVDLNSGNGYNPTHGIFKAPCNGTYWFSIDIGNRNHSGNIFLRKNSQTVEFIFAGYNVGWDMGGMSTIVEMLKGDEVWVEGEGYIGGGHKQ